jgi:endo-1,3(4)-beta-glucanase
VAIQEISQNMLQQTNQSSLYFSGKVRKITHSTQPRSDRGEVQALAKFAVMIVTINDLLKDKALAQTGLSQLKLAVARFAENKQQHPLVYESKVSRCLFDERSVSNAVQGAWGGVVSTETYTTGNSGADFGNTYYNDHHFHYGYFIYTAAVIGYLDPSWISANKDYVNTLVRDVANPSARDKFFPAWRNFDWYHGHSWAHGLYETFDGKDQESSSEDAMHVYAIKMWGRVSGDQNMTARQVFKGVQAPPSRPLCTGRAPPKSEPLTRLPGPTSSLPSSLAHCNNIICTQSPTPCSRPTSSATRQRESCSRTRSITRPTSVTISSTSRGST